MATISSLRPDDATPWDTSCTRTIPSHDMYNVLQVYVLTCTIVYIMCVHVYMECTHGMHGMHMSTYLLVDMLTVLTEVMLLGAGLILPYKDKPPPRYVKKHTQRGKIIKKKLVTMTSQYN